MRPLYLDFCGVNSFSERTVVDFKTLLSGGIFGIFGDTGAGKSTILDCIGFALYGKVNRIGKEGSSLADIVNYNCSKAEVNFEFETEWQGERAVYRVERTLNRNRGVQKAVLYKKENEIFTALCDGSTQVNDKIEREIIGIRFEDFKKCIALPQGEFSQFLQASRKDRLQLVAKLFSLEEYGYPLYCKVKERLDEKQNACSGVEGQLKAYESVTEEALRTAKSQLAELEENAARKKQQYQSAQTDVNDYAEKLKNKKKLEEIRRELTELSALRADMEEKRAALDKVQWAKQICDLKKLSEDTRNEYELSRTKANGLRIQEESITLRLKDENAKFEELCADERIEGLQKIAARIESAKGDVAALKDAETELETVREKYRRHKKEELAKYIGFDYDGEKRLLADGLEALPKEDNLLDFVNNHFKSALLAEEYYAFSEELSSLAEKHPAARADIQPLIDKYASRGVKGGVDIYAQAEYFRQCAEKKTAIQKKLSDLEIKKVGYAAATEREKELREEGERKQKEYLRRKEALSEITALGTAESVQRETEKWKAVKETHRKNAEKLQSQTVSLQRALSAEEAAQSAYAASLEQNKKQTAEWLAHSGISDEVEAALLVTRYGDYEKLKTETEEYFVKCGVLQSDEERLAALTANQNVTEEELSSKQTALGALQTELDGLCGREAVAKSEAERLEGQLREKCALEKRFASELHDKGLLEQLKDLVGNNKFMEFVAVEYLQEMASNANNLLLSLTNGRYFLVYDKNFEVGDNFNGGALRGVHTLSGGETFLVSLSLALSLSAAIHQKSLRPIEFFFLDEGFGSLDDELVDTVMDSLEKLKSENFSIGIISHVGELKNRLENKIMVVKADGEHGSLVRVY